jgi:adenylosuccinate synthase
MLVNPITLEKEAETLKSKGILDPWDLLSVDRDALVTNAYQVAANRLTETMRGKDRHGSCGMGIGETVDDSIRFPDMALRIGDLQDRTTLRSKLEFSRTQKLSRFIGQGLADDPNWKHICEGETGHEVDRYTRIGRRMKIVDRDHLRGLRTQELVFEGAQGVLLDQSYGFPPHTTWSNTTFDNALELLAEAGFDSGQAKRIGILRAYSTRHGAGPFPTADAAAEIDGDRDNVTNEFQQDFRVGSFDAVLAQYAHRVVGHLDEIVVTNLDKIKASHPQICVAYRFPNGTIINNLPAQAQPVSLEFQQRLTRDLEQAQPIYRKLHSKQDLVAAIHLIMKTPVAYCSSGPTAADKLTAQQYFEGRKWN